MDATMNIQKILETEMHHPQTDLDWTSDRSTSPLLTEGAQRKKKGYIQKKGSEKTSKIGQGNAIWAEKTSEERKKKELVSPQRQTTIPNSHRGESSPQNTPSLILSQSEVKSTSKITESDPQFDSQKKMPTEKLQNSLPGVQQPTDPNSRPLALLNLKQAPSRERCLRLRPITKTPLEGTNNTESLIKNESECETNPKYSDPFFVVRNEYPSPSSVDSINRRSWRNTVTDMNTSVDRRISPRIDRGKDKHDANLSFSPSSRQNQACEGDATEYEEESHPNSRLNKSLHSSKNSEILSSSSRPVINRKLKKSELMMDWFESGVNVSVRDGDRRYPCICLRVGTMQSFETVSAGGALDLYALRTPLEIAQQLTLYQHRVYSSIHPRELLLWVTTKNKQGDCPRLHSLVSHFNRIASWACQAVVTQMERKNRKTALTKIIEICRHCHELQNFMGVQALVSAFQHSSLQRMKKTISGVPPPLLKEMEVYSTLMSQSANFNSYRQKLSMIQPPYVPYVGLV
jgi:hypothetical protein